MPLNLNKWPLFLFSYFAFAAGAHRHTRKAPLKTSQQYPVSSIKTLGVNKSRTAVYYTSPRLKALYGRVKRQKGRLYKGITTVKKTQSFWDFLFYASMAFGFIVALTAFLLFLYGFGTLSLVFLILSTLIFVVASFASSFFWGDDGWPIILGFTLIALTVHLFMIYN